MRFASLYKHFMLSPASHLPVLAEDKSLLGFLSKEKLQIEMADLARSSLDIEEIPHELIELDISENLLSYFNAHSKIPVIDSQGVRFESWDKPRLLAEYTKLVGSKSSQSVGEGISNFENESRENLENSNSFAKEEIKNSKNPVQWFTQLILESFSDPLFATDLEGNSVFYNDRFEKEILSQQFFRDSVSFAERYLRDLNKDLFASFLKANNLDMNASQENGRVLQTILAKIGYMVRVVSLTQSDKLVGYLYHFILLKQSIQDSNSEGIVFPSLEEALANKLPIELVLKETESYYIYQSLLRNKRNVSHTAHELGVPRSTLQNRIRFLDIDKRFQDKKQTPVPRKRSSSPKPEKSQKLSESSTQSKERPKSKQQTTNPKPLTKSKTKAKPLSKKKTSKKKTKQRGSKGKKS
ncbi:MAG: transcriptional regulator [Leptospira sp.]|nr:MAG: transcriptional regulator [Leptospira sp.]